MTSFHNSIAAVENDRISRRYQTHRQDAECTSFPLPINTSSAYKRDGQAIAELGTQI